MVSFRATWSGLLVAGLFVQVAAGAEAGALASASATSSDELFTNTFIRHLRIEIAEKDMARLRAYRWRKEEAPEDRPTVPCTVLEDDARYTNVAVHLKGGFGSFRNVDSNPGLTLNFGKFAEGQQFHGLRKISLNNSVQDPTRITDKLCRELFARAGVPVPRADYATVELNRQYLGLYVLTEGWDKPFLKRYFKNVQGNLYDPVVGLDINKTLRVTSGENPDDQSALRAVAKAAADPDPAKRLARLEKLVDCDRFISFLALDVMLWNWDGYAINKNNYRVFHDLDTGRLVFMPHGMDQMFWKPEGPIMTGRNGLVARGILGTAEGRRRYLERFAQLRATVFDLKTVTNRVNELAARIRPAVNPGGLAGLFGNLQFDRTVNLLRNRIAQRARSIDEQLQGAKNTLRIATNETVRLTGWKPRPLSGSPVLERTVQPDALHLTAKGEAAGAWCTTVWLEEGNYRIDGRIKTQGVVISQDTPLAGVGFRVWSTRKVTDGVHWGWFPYRESRDYQRRGELVASNCVPVRLTGTRDWTDVTYEIELRQPLADLEVRCELYGTAGEAWFDLKSLRITRLTDSCP